MKQPPNTPTLIYAYLQTPNKALTRVDRLFWKKSELLLMPGHALLLGSASTHVSGD
ncbi:MAG TPA: hypothetical protein VJ602_11930 [Paludibacter sp.]|nr:hypothetical protein [Paludibacter sp.]